MTMPAWAFGIVASGFASAGAGSQGLAPEPSDIPALPPADPLQVWLFERPVPTAVLLGVAALVIVMVLLRIGRRRGALAAAGLGAAAVAAAIAIGGAVTTDRERLLSATAELTVATAAVDSAAMTRLLHPDCRVSLRGLRIPVGSLGDREAIISTVRSRLTGRLWQVSPVEVRAGMDGPRVGRSQVRVRAVDSGSDLPVFSWWAIDWQEHEGRWQAVQIEPLWIQGVG
ncbi:MAG: hypothetical protein AAFR96_11685 [Planctomycetota bacterium]